MFDYSTSHGNNPVHTHTQNSTITKETRSSKVSSIYRLYNIQVCTTVHMNQMNSIDQYETEIWQQPDFMKSFHIQQPLQEDTLKRSVFVGSGDSLAAAMLAQCYSGWQSRAMDPTEILSDVRITNTHDIYIVSVSGRTIAGIRTANISKQATAITTRLQSKLAKACTNTILLGSSVTGHSKPHQEKTISTREDVQKIANQIPTTTTTTAGSITFLDSALTCISLVRPLCMPLSPQRLLEMAQSDTQDIHIHKSLYVLGNPHTYPLAMYCAAKFYEVLGYNARYCRTEQFFHMELFSAESGATVILLEPDANRAAQLLEILKKARIEVIIPKNIIPDTTTSKANQIATQVAYITFFSQMLTLQIARRHHQRECHFITDTKLRAASDEMIY